MDDERGFIGQSMGVANDGTSFPIEIAASITGDGDLIVAIKDLSEIQQAHMDLRLRDDLLHSLVQITNGFINADLDSVDVIVDKSLGSIGGLLGVDRVYVFNYDMENGVTSNTHEWCAEGIEPQIDELQDVPLEAIPEWVDAHLDGQPILIGDVDSLPDGNVKDLLQPQGVKSLLTMPMFYDGGCMGFIGFDSVREHRDYSEIELDILNMFGNMLVNLRIRMESQQLIESVNNKNKALLNAFPDMILIIRDDGVIMDCHIPSGKRFAVDPVSSLGRHVSEVLPPMVVDRLLEAMDIIRQGGEPQKKTFTIEENGDVQVFEVRLLRYNDCFMAIGRVIA